MVANFWKWRKGSDKGSFLSAKEASPSLTESAKETAKDSTASVWSAIAAVAIPLALQKETMQKSSLHQGGQGQ